MGKIYIAVGLNREGVSIRLDIVLDNPKWLPTPRAC